MEEPASQELLILGLCSQASAGAGHHVRGTGASRSVCQPPGVGGGAWPPGPCPENPLWPVPRFCQAGLEKVSRLQRPLGRLLLKKLLSALAACLSGNAQWGPEHWEPAAAGQGRCSCPEGRGYTEGGCVGLVAP